MAGAAYALTVTAQTQKCEDCYQAVQWSQVDNRTQRTDWALDIYWEVYEEEVDGKKEKYLDVTTNIKNLKRQFDRNLTY